MLNTQKIDPATTEINDEFINILKLLMQGAENLYSYAPDDSRERTLIQAKNLSSSIAPPHLAKVLKFFCKSFSKVNFGDGNNRQYLYINNPLEDYSPHINNIGWFIILDLSVDDFKNFIDNLLQQHSQAKVLQLPPENPIAIPKNSASQLTVTLLDLEYGNDAWIFMMALALAVVAFATTMIGGLGLYVSGAIAASSGALVAGAGFFALCTDNNDQHRPSSAPANGICR